MQKLGIEGNTEIRDHDYPAMSMADSFPSSLEDEAHA